ncbi:glycolipid sulfotransferase [soil metagenome]
MVIRRRYVSPDEDSARWDDVVFRDGDIVISSRSKHGTTWLQMITLLLIHQRSELPAPLAQLSPWLDHLVEPLDTVIARLSAQDHRRVVKTHAPLDGIPLDPRVTYLVVARHPLDAAVSLYHQAANMDRERLHHLTGAPLPPSSSVSRPTVQAWLSHWIEHDAEPAAELDSLPGVLWHLTDAWSRRDAANVVLVHYADLLADLDAQMRRLAERLDIAVDTGDWHALVDAASFDRMRARAEHLVPDPVGVLRRPAAFFRNGTSGGGAASLTPAQFRQYHHRAAALAPPDLLAWLHR